MRQVDFGPGRTGLTTVGYTLLNADLTEYVARTTVGVSVDQGGGNYFADIALPAGVTIIIKWDTGQTPPIEAFEVVEAGATVPVPVVGAYYCSYADIDAKIVDIIDHVPTGKDPETWVYSQIAFCMEEIDGRLGDRYVVPFASPIPALIRTICMYLSISAVLNPGYVGEIPAESRYVDTYWKKGDDLLKAVQKGDIELSGVILNIVTIDGSQSSTADAGCEFVLNSLDSERDVIESGSMSTW